MLPPSRSKPISRWAVPMALLPMRDASDTASSTTLLARGVRPWLGAAPETPLPTLRCSTEHAVGDALLLTDQAQQQMLGANIAVAQILGSLLAQTQNFLCTGGKFILRHKGTLPFDLLF